MSDILYQAVAKIWVFLRIYEYPQSILLKPFLAINQPFWRPPISRNPPFAKICCGGVAEAGEVGWGSGTQCAVIGSPTCCVRNMLLLVIMTLITISIVLATCNHEYHANNNQNCENQVRWMIVLDLSGLSENRKRSVAIFAWPKGQLFVSVSIFSTDASFRAMNQCEAKLTWNQAAWRSADHWGNRSIKWIWNRIKTYGAKVSWNIHIAALWKRRALKYRLLAAYEI